LAHRPCAYALRDELQRLSLLGETPDGKKIYFGSLASDSQLLRELGRLRECSFRAVGEGTGSACDVDSFDTWYEHIILWCPEQFEVVGAYRVAHGEKIYAQRGVDGFYTQSLFQLDASTQQRLREGMELGRSFVAPAYWGTRSLDYLWLGIGAYISRYPSIRYLMGPVSISAALPEQARDHLVACYEKQRGDIVHSTSARTPYQFNTARPWYCELDHETNTKLLKENLARLGVRIPILFKQYTELCEPGGVRFLGFNVDQHFNNVVDGLIEVDLQRMLPKKRARYLGHATLKQHGLLERTSE
jgi:hypothetical protein